MSANNGDLLSQAGADGLGIVMQPTFIAHDYVKSGDLVPILTKTNWPHTTAWAVYPPTRHLSYRVREFIDFLVNYFAETPYWDEGLRPALTCQDGVVAPPGIFTYSSGHT